MAAPQSIAERFWAKVDRRGPDECWSWLGSHDRFGRGDFYWSREVEKVKAPRASWWLTYGEPPPRELSVCHSCDNPACVNPAHLWLGTHRANMQDAYTKGRIVHPAPLYGQANINGRKRECKRGHPLSGENLYVFPDGRRRCNVCQRELRQAYKRKISALAPSAAPGEGEP